MLIFAERVLAGSLHRNIWWMDADGGCYAVATFCSIDGWYVLPIYVVTFSQKEMETLLGGETLVVGTEELWYLSPLKCGKEPILPPVVMNLWLYTSCVGEEVWLMKDIKDLGPWGLYGRTPEGEKRLVEMSTKLELHTAN